MSKYNKIQKDYNDLLEIIFPLMNTLQDDEEKQMCIDWLTKLGDCSPEDGFVRNQYLLLLCLQLSNHASLGNPFTDPPPVGRLHQLSLQVGSVEDFKKITSKDNQPRRWSTVIHTGDYGNQESSHTKMSNIMKSVKAQFSCSKGKSVDDSNNIVYGEKYIFGKTTKLASMEEQKLKIDGSVSNLLQEYRDYEEVEKKSEISIVALKHGVEKHIELLNKFQKANDEILDNYAELMKEIEIKEQKILDWTNAVQDTFIKLVEELQLETDCKNQQCIELRKKVQEFDRMILLPRNKMND